jgi:hypothetical protein
MAHISQHQDAAFRRSHTTELSPILLHWQDWACLSLGILMAASPWLLGYTGLEDVTLNAVLIGFLVAALAALSLTLLDRWEAYLNFMLGLWLILSPWLLRFEYYDRVKFAHLAIGAFILVIAAQEIWQNRRVPDRR